VLGVASLGAKRWAAGASALVAAALGAAGLGPVWTSVARPAAEGPTTSLTVAVANVDFRNETPETAAEALAAVGADVLVTLESFTAYRAPDSALSRAYPFVINRVRWIYTGAWLWSRPEIVAGRKRDTDVDAPASAWGRIVLPDGAALDVLGLHFRRPVTEPQEGQIAGLDALTTDLARPFVVVGDFNAAPWSEAMRRVSHALGADIVGGLRWTWRSRRAGWLGPLGGVAQLPIDHILVSPGVGVDSVETFAIPGSDHRGVLARLRVPLSTGAAAAPAAPEP
jgi:endonuclease/exonuclease/phosphatase (EEP) superfamily protein YafD